MLTGANVTGAAAGRARFAHADLRGVAFVGADVTDADFTGARTDGTEFIPFRES